MSKVGQRVYDEENGYGTVIREVRNHHGRIWAYYVEYDDCGVRFRLSINPVTEQEA